MERIFVYSDEKSNRFWTIRTQGNMVTIVSGKQATLGQARIKEFADEVTCLKEVEKLIAGKIRKGYVEQAHTPSEPGVTTVEKPRTVSPGGLRRNLRQQRQVLSVSILCWLCHNTDAGRISGRWKVLQMV